MVSERRKRKVEYEGNIYYWFVKKNRSGIPRIHILSGDKKICLEYPLLDTELSVTPREIKGHLKNILKTEGGAQNEP